MNQTRKAEIILGLVFLFFFVWMMLIIRSFPDQNPQRIYKFLSETGCDVAGITFVQTESRNVYKSSSPINYQGEFVEYWRVRYYPGSVLHYWIEPINNGRPILKSCFTGSM